MTTLLAAARAWRFLDSGAADGATNMAWDLALLDHARRSGEAVLRVYAWSRPTLSLGRHERARGRFDEATLAARGIDVVRRPTGGRALLHDHEVTYAVAAPAHGVSLGASYRAINALLIDALARLGVRARPADRRGAPRRPGSAPCFAEPNEGELVVDGAKLVGSAQWRDGDAFVQHGSILLADDQSRIADLTRADDRATGSTPVPVATLEGGLGRRVAHDEVRDALGAALDAALATSAVTSTPFAESDPGTLRDVEAHRALFASAAWTWRR